MSAVWNSVKGPIQLMYYQNVLLLGEGVIPLSNQK